MDDRLARASWCQHTTPGRPTQYVLSDGDERRRVEGLHVGGAKAVAAVEPGVELVVQLVEVTQVEPRVLRPASRAQHARLLANQLQPQHAAASSATTTARSSVSGNHNSTQQRQRQPRQHAAASAAVHSLHKISFRSPICLYVALSHVYLQSWRKLRYINYETFDFCI